MTTATTVRRPGYPLPPQPLPPVLRSQRTIAQTVGNTIVGLILGGIFLAAVIKLTVIATALTLYFIPAVVAKMRDHRNAGAILILNLLLGWTLIGWVVAMVWAFTKSPTERREASVSPGASKQCPSCGESIRTEARVCRYCGRDLPTEPKRVEPRRAPSAQAREVKPLNAFRTLAIFACAGIAIFSIYGLIGGLDGTSRKTVSVSEAAVQGEPATRVSEGPVQAGPSAEASVPPVAPRVALGPLVDALRAMPSVKVVQQPPVAPETDAQSAVAWKIAPRSTLPDSTAYTSNLVICLSGEQPLKCRLDLLTATHAENVRQVEYRTNLTRCILGKQPCQLGSLSQADLERISRYSPQTVALPTEPTYVPPTPTSVRQPELSRPIEPSTVAARPLCAENGSCYGDISAATSRPKTVHVSGYYRKDGTYVRGHFAADRGDDH